MLFNYSDFTFSGNDVTPITMALNGASGYPQACQALTAMLSKNTLNPADITVLYRNYSAADPPPTDLIRTPQFLGKVDNFYSHFTFVLILQNCWWILCSNQE